MRTDIDPKAYLLLLAPVALLYLTYSSFRNWKSSLLQKIIFFVSVTGLISQIWSLYQLFQGDQFKSIGAAVLYALVLFIVLPVIIVFEIADMIKNKS